MHICSTARMGAPDDPSAVVTPDCQVLGIDGLHVIDASIMPEIVRGNINLTVIAMAELAVARLRGKYASQANAPQSSAVANDVSA